MERHLFYDNSNIISDATVDDTLDATSTASFRHQQRQQHHHREEFMKYVQRGKYCELDSTRLLQELLQLVVQLGENATTTTDSAATKTTTTNDKSYHFDRHGFFCWWNFWFFFHFILFCRFYYYIDISFLLNETPCPSREKGKQRRDME